MVLKYVDLEAAARRRLWADFLGGLRPAADVSPADLDMLAQYTMNGQQIKNAVKTAESLAVFMERPLGLADLQIVLRTQAEFADAFVANDSGTLESKADGLPARYICWAHFKTHSKKPSSHL